MSFLLNWLNFSVKDGIKDAINTDKTIDGSMLLLTRLTDAALLTPIFLSLLLIMSKINLSE